MTKTIYSYHPDSGEYVSTASADESPLEPGVFLVPAFATGIKPPDAGANQAPAFADGKWHLVADWRGVPLFSTIDGSPVSTISEIGKTPADAGATEVPPPRPAHSWQSGAWLQDAGLVAAQLAAAKTSGLARIADFAKSKRALIAGTGDDAEIAGWNNKLRIALAVVAGTATEADQYAFAAEIEARGLGETPDVFRAKVIRNAEFYGRAVGVIDGLKRRAQDAVAAASTPEEVAAVLAGMKVEAEAAYARLMATV